MREEDKQMRCLTLCLLVLKMLCCGWGLGVAPDRCLGQEPAQREARPERLPIIYSVRVAGVALVDNEQSILAVYHDGSVMKWDISTRMGKQGSPLLLRDLGVILVSPGVPPRSDARGRVSGCAVSHDGKTMICWDVGRPRLRLYDCSGADKWRFILADLQYDFVATARRANVCASGRRSGAMDIWDLDSPQTQRRLGGEGDSANTCIALSPSGKHCLISREKEGPQVWSVSDVSKAAINLHGASERVCAAIWITDQKLVTGGGKYGKSELLVWDIGSPARPVRFDTGGLARITSLAVAPERGLLACGSTVEDVVELWDLARSRLIETIDPRMHGVTALAFSTSAHMLVIGGVDGSIRIKTIKEAEAAADTTP